MLLLNNLPKLIQLVQLMKLQNNLCKFVKKKCTISRHTLAQLGKQCANLI